MICFVFARALPDRTLIREQVDKSLKSAIVFSREELGKLWLGRNSIIKLQL
jgi:hypothetical protein